MTAFAPGTTWNEILAANPDAVIFGALGINPGSGNPGIVALVDVLELGYGGDSVTYDFELDHVATHKDQCKDGAAGSLAVLRVWIYYAAMILLFGAEFTQSYVGRRGEIVPEQGAIRLDDDRSRAASSRA